LKKKLLAVFGVLSIICRAGAYSPPPGGENLFFFGYPDITSSAYSSSGGAIFSAGPYSTVLNPALTAQEQRIAADFGWTGLVQTRYGDNFGDAFHIGALFPTRWGVWTAATQMVFVPVLQMPLGNMFSFRAGWSRDITQEICVGASIYAAGISKYGDDFAIASDLGFVWRLGTLWIFKDARVSGVLANLGKTFVTDHYDTYPGFITAKAGIAALFLDTNEIKAGFSSDISIPTFQNFVFSVGVQAEIVKMITISLGWDMNAYELGKGWDPHTPFISIGFKTTINTGKSGFMKEQGWEKSDINGTFIWQQLNDEIQMISTGATIKFGSADSDAPIIEIGEAE
jgi:hypothetical protein